MSWRRLWIGAAVAVVVAVPVAAQDYLVHTYTEGDGLPSSSVYGLTQDASGRMWFATRGGLATYDGQNWSAVSPSHGLRSAGWRVLATDDRGRVWGASSELLVAVLEAGRWQSLPRPDLRRDCQLEGLAVTPGDPTRVVLGTTCGLLLGENEVWQLLGVEHGMPDARVKDVEIVDDAVYVATEGGLAILDAGSRRLAAPGFVLPDGPVLALAADTREPPFLWIIGEDWIGQSERGQFRLIQGDLSLIGGALHQSAVADGDGGVYFGSNQALYHFHEERGLMRLDENNGLIAGGVEDVFRDREHNIWAADTRGVSKIVSLRFATLRKAHGLLEDEVTAVLERRDGSFALGHRGGLTLVDLETGKQRVLDFKGPEKSRIEPALIRVLDLAEDAAGVVWIAGNRLGLGRYDGRTLEWSRSSNPDGVTSVVVDRKNRLWVSSVSQVLVGNGERLEPLPTPSFATHGVRRLILAPDGSIYALTAGGGVYRLHEGNWIRWTHPEPAGFNNVYALLVRDDTVWVGTSHGLAVLSEHGIRPAAAPLPVIERPVYFIVADRSDRVWFGTDNGVLRWDGGPALQGFTVEDGLGGRETNRAAGVLDSMGRVWIGTTRGVSIYREELDRTVPVPPIVHLNQLEASGTVHALDGPVNLRPHRNDLLFSFSAISFYDERDVRLSTWLEGYERGWSASYASTDRRLRFTHLPAGRYRLHIKAGNAAGLWSEAVSSPEIVIASPLWGRTWFWIVMSAMAGLLYFAAQRHVYQRRYARQLEAEVQQRVADLRRVEAELAKAQRLEALGLLAGGIAHDFNNLLMVVLGNLSLLARQCSDRSRRWISEAETAIEQARHLTVQLLTFSRGGAPIRRGTRIDDMIRDSAGFVLSGSKVACDIDLAPDLQPVSIDTGQISQLLNNLLINAVQSMPDGGVIHLSARNAKDVLGLPPGPYVEISVRDEGAGIPADNLQRVFDPYFTTKAGGSGLGLSTAYSIARRHDGLLTVESQPGQGSTFSLYLPVSQAHDDSRPPPAASAERFDYTRILVMDDDAPVREVIAEMLQSLGCEVATTTDGEEALRRYVEARASGRPFDGLILDLTVPGGMGGEKTLQHLLQLDPEARAIVASGYANAAVMSEYLDHGFKAVLRKPFRREDIVEALRKVVRRRGDHPRGRASALLRQRN